MEKKRLSIKIAPDLYNEIVKLSDVTGMKIGFLIDKAVNQYLKRRKWNSKGA